MPKFLKDKLKAEYPNNPHSVYGTMNAIGAMRGNKETAKGKRMQAKHDRDMAQKPKRHARKAKSDSASNYGGESHAYNFRMKKPARGAAY